MKFIEVQSTDVDIIEEIIRIEEEAFGKNGGVDYWILKPLVRYGKVFVLMQEDKILSIAEFMRSCDGEEAFLYGLCTRKEMRSRGYAREVLAKSEDYFKGIGAKKLGLTVAEDNVEAIKLYNNLGYEVGELQEDEYGPGIDRLYMYKKIN